MKEDRLRDLQSILLKMLNDITKICDENGIQYFLDGGTMLGAVRHHGFIPWDDDLDVAMRLRTIKNWIRSFRVNYRTICFGKPQKRIRQCLMVVT